MLTLDTNVRRRRWRQTPVHRRAMWMTLWAALPALLTMAGLLWVGDFSPRVGWTFGTLAVLFLLGGIAAVRSTVMRPLQTLANVLAAVREGDFSIRVRGSADDDSLGAVIREVNTLGETLRTQRLGAHEAEALLDKVMDEIPVAVFAFDEDCHLALVNRSGELLLARPEKVLLGHSAAELGLGECLTGEPEQIAELDLPGAKGRFKMHREPFREGGKRHELLVLADVSAPLREEERQAWRRIVRVLGHEINNSLAPIRSLAGSLRNLISRDPLDADWREDVTSGLDVIASRSDSLNRFMAAYASLARLPAPTKVVQPIAPLVRRAAGLEQRANVKVTPGPDLEVAMDGDQIEQVLINLIKNAVEAAGETGGGVEVTWADADARIEVCVCDEGPGIGTTSNLFVPFFTTKPKGSGIGLVLCRQIAEAHGGTLTLENRASGPGAVARLQLPKG